MLNTIGMISGKKPPRLTKGIPIGDSESPLGIVYTSFGNGSSVSTKFLPAMPDAKLGAYCYLMNNSNLTTTDDTEFNASLVKISTVDATSWNYSKFYRGVVTQNMIDNGLNFSGGSSLASMFIIYWKQYNPVRNILELDIQGYAPANATQQVTPNMTVTGDNNVGNFMLLIQTTGFYWTTAAAELTGWDLDVDRYGTSSNYGCFTIYKKCIESDLELPITLTEGSFNTRSGSGTSQAWCLAMLAQNPYSAV